MDLKTTNKGPHHDYDWSYEACATPAKTKCGPPEGTLKHVLFNPIRDVVPVARLEAFRALKLSRLESFRALKSIGQIGGF